ncbi:MAG: isoprenylcysteine carboxylmethyltransferase family protein [Anaerolineales bacterium]
MYAVVIAVLFLTVMSIWTLWQVRRDFREGDTLRPETIASVLAFYTLHFAIELIAAWARLWPYSAYRCPSIILGVILSLIGTVFLALGILHMEDLQSMTGMETGELVTSGVFRWSRHPQNLGWGLFMIGVGLVSRSLLALLMALIFWVMFVAYVPIEEHYLEDLYGEAYREYKQRTYRYFGPPKKKGGNDP